MVYAFEFEIIRYEQTGVSYWLAGVDKFVYKRENCGCIRSSKVSYIQIGYPTPSVIRKFKVSARMCSYYRLVKRATRTGQPRIKPLLKIFFCLFPEETSTECIMLYECIFVNVHARDSQGELP